MKLIVKTLWIPSAILVVIFLGLSLIISSILTGNAQKGQESELQALVASESRRIMTGLSLVTATQQPGDAMLGLEGKDDTLAKDVVTLVANLGLDGVVFTDLKGKTLYSTVKDPPANLDKVVSGLDGKKMEKRLLVLDNYLVALGSIKDVDTIKGYLVFLVTIPPSLQAVVEHTMQGMDKGQQGIKQPSIREEIEAIRDEIVTVSDAFLKQVLTTFSILLVAGLALVMVVLLVIARGILGPVNLVKGNVEVMSSGDLTQRIAIPAKKDEIFEMAEGVNRMADGLSNIARMLHLQAATLGSASEGFIPFFEGLKQQAAMLQKSAREAMNSNDHIDGETYQLRANVDKVAQTIEGFIRKVHQLGENISNIAAAAEEASQNVSTMASAAEEMSSNVNSVNSNLQRVAESVDSVIHATQQVNASQEEVRRRCQSAVTSSGLADQHANGASQVMESLDKAAVEIGKVVNVIRNIAEQTKMLALNAAIEAAGAGEAGKGFAVVANEVKELARQTSEATQMIGQRIGEIQVQTKSARHAVGEIASQIQQVNSGQGQILQAVETQGVAMGRIVGDIDKVSTAAQEVTRNAHELELAIQEVARAAAEAAMGTAEIARASSDAANQADYLIRDGQGADQEVKAVQNMGQGILESSAEVQKRGLLTYDSANAMAGWISQAQTMRDIINQTSEGLLRSATQLNIGTEPYDVRKIKSAHLNWLARLTESVAAGILMPEKDITNSHQCAFGKWYDTEGLQRFGHIEIFKQVGIAHEKVHLKGREVYELSKAGKHGEALSLVQQLVDRERAELFSLLDEMYQSHDVWHNP
ncbi:MAG: HAMP domain-containing protein [Magnetococcales bacterium]|nr:CZB domain-containing protein [Magnetococcales bacterium]NGZ28591.1 HAMP domain-containing protein [Magnetococcales bacterium]